MPRTKINRNASNKRARRNSTELEELLREFDVEIEGSIELLKDRHRRYLKEIDETFELLTKTTPERILKMTIGDVRKLVDLSDPIEQLVEDKMATLNVTVKEIQMQRADEEEASQKSFRSGRSTATTASYQNVSIVAPLQKSKIRRRSKSVSSVAASSHTPGPRAMMSAQKVIAPQTGTGHISRAKYRTPINAGVQRAKAASADRVTTITPKVNPLNPFSILRHARVGEAVFSITGSPVVPANVCESTANVNIPVADGILSIRPQTIDPSHIDPQWLGKIDSNTMNHLRTLKQNLDIIMHRFDKK